MEYGAIDLHKRESQVRIVTAEGEIIDRRIPTTRERFTATFWGRARMQILIEASTESEWVARHLESLGHDVIVADPNYGAMYARRSRRVKTDRRDAAALAEAPGWLRGLRALTGGLSLQRGCAYDQRADLTSRFIKAPTAIIIAGYRGGRKQNEDHRPCAEPLSTGGEHRIPYPAAQRRFAPITMPWST